MSQGNVEVVRSIYTEWERGNFWTPEFFDPEVHVRWADPIFARHAETHGAEALAKAVKGMLDAYEQVTATAERIVETAEHVVVADVWRGRGKASGIELDSRRASAWTISGGKATEVVFHDQRPDPLEAAGIPAMSEENVEIVRRVYDAWERGDVLDALEALHPAVVWEAIEDAPDAGTYRGHAGVRAYMEDWIEGFELGSMDFEEVVETEDSLVIVQRAHTKERRTGLETSLGFAVAYTFRDGKLIAAKEYATRAEAVEAAGRSE
jgi:ketosteroid isomerase-like protein